MEYKLKSTTRTEKGEKIRSKSILPGVVYGASKDTTSISLENGLFCKLFDQAGSSSLIDLEIDGKYEGKVLVQDVAYNPVTDRISHVDLRRIEMDKEMTATVELNFIGESPAIKEAGGTLVKNVEEVEVRCLPKDLVSEINVDLNSLKTFDDIIRVKDLVVPVGVIIEYANIEDAVAKVIPAMTEDEIKALEESETDVAKVEVAGEKKEEGEAEEGKKEQGEAKEGSDKKGADKGGDKK
ncbi:MAG: 50S ribosomal protein L25 [bacterium]